MLALTINNNFLKLVSRKHKLFKKVPLSSSVINDCIITNQEKFAGILKDIIVKEGLTTKNITIGLNEEKTYLLKLTAPVNIKDPSPMVQESLKRSVPYKLDQLYTTFKTVSKTEDNNILQVVAVEKELVDGYLQTLESAGLKVRGLVPLALSLANLTAEDKRPHLIICPENNELVFILVDTSGAVLFSATNSLINPPNKTHNSILKETENIIEFGEKTYQIGNIKKIYICGENSKKVAISLKKAKSPIEELEIEPAEFCKPLSLLQFDDPDLTIPPEPKAKKSKFALPKIAKFLKSFSN